MQISSQVHIRKRPKFVRKPPEGGGGTPGRGLDAEETDASSRLEPLSDRETSDMGGPRVLACYSVDGLYYPGEDSFACMIKALFHFPLKNSSYCKETAKINK